MDLIPKSSLDRNKKMDKTLLVDTISVNSYITIHSSLFWLVLVWFLLGFSLVWLSLDLPARDPIRAAAPAPTPAPMATPIATFPHVGMSLDLSSDCLVVIVCSWLKVLGCCFLWLILLSIPTLTRCRLSLVIFSKFSMISLYRIRSSCSFSLRFPSVLVNVEFEVIWLSYIGSLGWTTLFLRFLTCFIFLV